MSNKLIYLLLAAALAAFWVGVVTAVWHWSA